jgi:hypothetical protein
VFFLAACATTPTYDEPEPARADGGVPELEGGAPKDGGVTKEGGATVDGSPGTDSGGGGAPRIPCGGTFCRSDQKCEAGVCTFPCTGSQVPGDYPNLQSAVTALAALDSTICYKAQVTTEGVTVSDPSNRNRVLKIIGVTADKSALGSLVVSTGFSSVEVSGIFAQQGITVNAAKATFRGMRIGNTIANPSLTILQTSGRTTDVTVDGCDIPAYPNGQGIQITNNLSTPTVLVLTNSWVHGGAYGLSVQGAGSQLTLSVVNNTIEKAGFGVHFGQSQGTVTLSNNIVSGHTTTGIVVSNATAVPGITSSNNALFGNASNYASFAVAGPGYVTADCQMDTTTPVPQTKPGSPCRGTADPAKAPKVDYWNASRVPPVDIGAVQGP